MKKIILMVSLLITSSSCFAIASFSSSSGDLVIRDVVVDENTVYDSVTLQLDLNSSTFSILDATLKDTSFPDSALDTFSENGLKIDFFGCNLSGKNQITCLTKIVASNQNLEIKAFGKDDSRISQLFDNLSNEYGASTVTALDMTDSLLLDFTLIKGIPVEVKFIYNNINPSATSISLFEPLFQNEFTFIEGTFTNIDF